MNLRETIEYVRATEKELAIINAAAPGEIADELSTFFHTQNVRITTRTTASGSPADLGVLSNEDGVLELCELDRLRDLVNHAGSTPSTLGISDSAYADVLKHLKETTFSSYSTADMTAASREIEDRARRTGRGTIHTGFQECSRMLDQRSTYVDLGRSGVTVFTYGVPDIPPPDFDGVTVQGVEADEIAAHWFVVFDGGGTPTQKSALLAEERTAESYYGFWTYDPGIVDSLCEYLDEAYRSADRTNFDPEP